MTKAEAIDKAIEQVPILAVITTRDEAGTHFMARYYYGDLRALEAEGLITIHRPIHAQTGIPYSQEYWSVEVTEAGADLVDAWPEYCPA